MTTFPTAVRGLVCNVDGIGGLAINEKPKKSDKPDDKPNPQQQVPTVEVARKNVEQAKLQEKQAMEKQKQQEMFTTAMDKGREADEATKKALKYKPNSTAGKKAHHAAHVAHKDAHKHFQGVSGEKGGLMLDQRAAAERKAAKHKKLAETHAAMSEGFGNSLGGAGGESEKKPVKNVETGHPGTTVLIG